MTERHAPKLLVPSPGQHLPCLDGVRGLAIIVVMFYHYEVRAWPWKAGLGKLGWLVASEGWLGVNLFFVLSGFLITGILFDTKDCANFFRVFYARRTLRIFPVYYMMLTFMFIIVPVFSGAGTPLGRQLWSWFYLTNVPIAFDGFSGTPWFTAHFWSLAIEEQFYLLWPLLVFARPLRSLVRICVGLLVATLAARVICHALGVPWHFTSYFTLLRFDDLVCGALAALLLRDQQYGQKLLRVAWACMIALGVACLALVLWRHFPAMWDGVTHTVGFSVFSAFFAVMIVVAVTSPSRSLVARFWSNPALRFFGKYSYGMYVYHQYMRRGIDSLGLDVEKLTYYQRSAAVGHATYLSLNFAGTLVLALVSWHVLERPILGLKARFPYVPRQAAPRHVNTGALCRNEEAIHSQ
jgi:peptidoglycan/LPS O-acetylase OafA/YrhL